MRTTRNEGELHHSDIGDLKGTISAIYVFNSGEPGTYQIWMQARNNRGPSGPGPRQNWTP